MEMEAIDVKLADPQPLECLNGSLIPPFLSKTFDLVDEPSLDAIISWSCNGRSFVVKDPMEFSKSVLPRNFKHNNLSSFVRQLNTYGFRKIDPDRLEFANEGFKQGNKHLLRNIQRRKSPQSPKQGGSYLEPSFVETSRSIVEGEVKRLIKEKNSLMQDVVELQQQHVGTVHCMKSLNQKITMAEQRQKQTISFVAKLFQNPALVSSVEQINDQTDVGSSSRKKRFANLPMLKYSPSISNVPSITAATDLRQISPKEGHDNIPQKDVVHLGSSVKVENVATQKPSIATEFTGEQEFIHNEKVRKGEADNHFSEQEFSREPFALFENFQEVVSPAVESVIEPENIWSDGLDTIPDVSNFDYESWVDSTHYDVSDFGGTSELSAIWDFDSPQHPRADNYR